MRYNKKKNIVSEKVENGEILFDTEKLSFYFLNPIGAEIWRYLDKVEYSSLIDRLKDKYEVKPSVLKRDVNLFIEELQKEELLTI